VDDPALDKIADMLADKLTSSKRAQWIDPETHSEHHSFVGKQIQRESDLMELRQRIVMSACIWAIPLY